MSAGAFVLSKYEDSEGRIYPCRVQPETLDLTIGATANAAPAGDTTERVFAKMRGSKSEIGIIARAVRLSWTTAPPTNYKPGATVTVPVMSTAAFSSYTIGATGTYLGTDVTVQSRISEGGLGIAV